jgi:hypothetical protein
MAAIRAAGVGTIRTIYIAPPRCWFKQQTVTDSNKTVRMRPDGLFRTLLQSYFQIIIFWAIRQAEQYPQVTAMLRKPVVILRCKTPPVGAGLLVA